MAEMRMAEMRMLIGSCLWEVAKRVAGQGLAMRGGATHTPDRLANPRAHCRLRLRLVRPSRGRSRQPRRRARPSRSPA